MKINRSLLLDVITFVPGSFLIYWIMPRDFDFYNIAGFFSLGWPHTIAILHVILLGLGIFGDYGMMAISDKPNMKEKIRSKKIRWLFMIPSFLAGTYIAFAVDVFL